MREQLLKASQNNLSPEFIKVFVVGVLNAGGISIPQAVLLTNMRWRAERA